MGEHRIRRTVVTHIPKPIKRCLLPLYEVRLRMRKRRLSRDGVWAYWRNPPPSDNFNENQSPEAYLSGWDRSEFLVGLITKYLGPKASIMEVGCNVGRNLECLRQHGYGSLTGIEISEGAIAALRKHYPLLGGLATLHVDAVENVIKTLADNSYDVVFGMGAFQHIHTDSNWVFPEIARVARVAVITMEDEHGISRRNFQRNYARVFRRYGFYEVEHMELSHLSNMWGEGGHYIGRVMRKRWIQW